MADHLKETATKWGNGYRFRFYRNGARIPDAEADRIVREHYYEEVRKDTFPGGYSTTWAIGPRLDEASLTDHSDMI